MNDCRHVPLPNSASKEIFGPALDVGSEVDIVLFRCEIELLRGVVPMFVHEFFGVRIFQFL